MTSTLSTNSITLAGRPARAIPAAATFAAAAISVAFPPKQAPIMSTDEVRVNEEFSDVGLAEIFLHHRMLVVPVVHAGRPRGVINPYRVLRRLAGDFPGADLEPQAAVRSRSLTDEVAGRSRSPTILPRRGAGRRSGLRNAQSVAIVGLEDDREQEG